MREDFARTLALLRQEKGVSQREAAKALGISQGLLSHYENGVREPGLNFVTRACDYYRVSADFMLGRSLDRDGVTIGAEELYDASEDKNNVLRGSVMATLQKKLLVNSVSLLFDLLGKVGRREAIMSAAAYLGTGVYKLFRYLCRFSPDATEDLFNIPVNHFHAGVVTADMLCAEAEFTDALAAHAKEKGTFPSMGHEALSTAYPAAYQSLYQVVHTTGDRVQRQMEGRKGKQEKK